MVKKTKFYNELVRARNNDEVALINVIDKIMPLIEKYSKDSTGQANDDLRSVLIQYTIEIVRDKDFADKLLKN